MGRFSLKCEARQTRLSDELNFTGMDLKFE
jgi:hypothetical protein